MQVLGYLKTVLCCRFWAANQQLLHTCQSPGKVDEETLHLLTDQIEVHRPKASKTYIAGVTPFPRKKQDNNNKSPKTLAAGTFS
jgi:hypothetical protein